MDTLLNLFKSIIESDLPNKSKLIKKIQKLTPGQQDYLQEIIKKEKGIKENVIDMLLESQTSTKSDAKKAVKALSKKLSVPYKEKRFPISEKEFQSIIEEAVQDKEKSLALMLMIGPEGMKDLEKELKKYEKSGYKNISAKDITIARKELKEFYTFVFKTEKKYREEVEKKILIELIKAEEEKQKILKKGIAELQKM